jgi:glycosyltransferase involved in cell wall biosynthesis
MSRSFDQQSQLQARKTTATMTQPIPIALGITDLDVGGAEKTLVELVLRLDRARWSPAVVCLFPLGPLAQRLTNAGVPVESLGMRSSIDFYRGVRRWTEILRIQSPRLLQTFLFHANFMASVAGPQAGVPILFAGHRVADRRPGVRGLLERWTSSRFDCHVCVSRQVREFTQRRTSLPDDQFIVIPNGVDDERFRRAKPVDLSRLGIDKDCVVLLTLGRLDWQKGLDVLFEALARLRRFAASIDKVRLVCVGAGPEEVNLRRRCKKLGLDGIVHFAGWQPNPEQWLAAADALILPSRWEGMPNAVLEAMAAGRPVVATDVEGVGELVQPGRTGWLIPPSAPSALADALVEMLARPDLRTQFGAAGQSLVASSFTYEQMTARYESLWLSHLERQGAPRRTPFPGGAPTE